VKASPNSPLAHIARAQVLRAQRRCEEAIPEYETVIVLDQNWAGAYTNLGWCKLLTGSLEETIPLHEKAIRLSPRDPTEVALWYWRIGAVHLLQSHTDEAIVWFEKARSAKPELFVARAYLASAYALRGEIERAAAGLAEAQSLSPGGRFWSIARLRANRDYGVPKVQALFESTFFAGLRKAGMREE
jgi:adenylate cyclase